MQDEDLYGPPPFTTRMDQHDGVRVVVFEGELDIASAPDAAQALADAFADADGVVLDLSALTFVDSSGLAMLFNTQRRLGADQRLLVAGSPERILRVFTTVRAAAVLELQGSTGDAVAALRAAHPSR